MKLVSKLLIVTMSAVLSVPALSFGLSDVTGNKETKSSSVDSYAAQDKLVKQYVSAAMDITVAQKYLALALGLKEEAASADEIIESLSSGAVMDSDAIERTTETSSNIDEKINQKMVEGSELSAESKATYAKAFEPYISGLIETKKNNS